MSCTDISRGLTSQSASGLDGVKFGGLGKHVPVIVIVVTRNLCSPWQLYIKFLIMCIQNHTFRTHWLISFNVYNVQILIR
jgi:hypothetical protein